MNPKAMSGKANAVKDVNYIAKGEKRLVPLHEMGPQGSKECVDDEGVCEGGGGRYSTEELPPNKLPYQYNVLLVPPPPENYVGGLE